MNKCPPIITLTPPPQPPNPACKRQLNSIELNPSPLLLVVDYVEEIFQTFLSASNDDLKGAAAKLKQITPLPMNSMLERESKTDAIKKKTDRSKKIVEDVPPTTPGKKAHIQFLHLSVGERVGMPREE